jgi:hypothetical protein
VPNNTDITTQYSKLCEYKDDNICNITSNENKQKGYIFGNGGYPDIIFTLFKDILFDDDESDKIYSYYENITFINYENKSSIAIVDLQSANNTFFFISKY